MILKSPAMPLTCKANVTNSRVTSVCLRINSNYLLLRRIKNLMFTNALVVVDAKNFTHIIELNAKKVYLTKS